jgi:hypothetical protein
VIRFSRIFAFSIRTHIQNYFVGISPISSIADTQRIYGTHPSHREPHRLGHRTLQRRTTPCCLAIPQNEITQHVSHPVKIDRRRLDVRVIQPLQDESLIICRFVVDPASHHSIAPAASTSNYDAQAASSDAD